MFFLRSKRLIERRSFLLSVGRRGGRGDSGGEVSTQG